jgi:hypothetical protein
MTAKHNLVPGDMFKRSRGSGGEAQCFALRENGSSFPTRDIDEDHETFLFLCEVGDMFLVVSGFGDVTYVWNGHTECVWEKI